MTRRSCAIYATGIVCAHLLIVGIALVVAQVFQTMIHSRLKKVSRSGNSLTVIKLDGFSDCLAFHTSPHLSQFNGFKCFICSGQSCAFSISLVVRDGMQGHFSRCACVYCPNLMNLSFIFLLHSASPAQRDERKALPLMNSRDPRLCSV